MFNIVLDTNLLVSAFITPQGESYEILRQAKEHNLYLSPFILSEVWRTLQYPRIRDKYQYTESKVERYLHDLASSGLMFETKRLLDICSDPKDNDILACAVEAQADYLVTRNIKHFPKQYEMVKILSPKEFLTLIKS